jgi:transposase-like protein
MHGQWHYLYRAIDRDGNLVDTMLSKTRDLVAAKAFSEKLRSACGFLAGEKPVRSAETIHVVA